MTAPLPPVRPLPGPPTGPTVDDPTGLRYDRADLDEPTTTRQAGDGWPLTGRGITVDDPLCGHLPGDVHDEDCAYWRGVALGEYAAPDGTYMTPVVSLPPFNLRQLAAQHVTAAELDRRERGVA